MVGARRASGTWNRSDPMEVTCRTRQFRRSTMDNAATKKRGGDPQVPQKSKAEQPDDAMERKLEQGLEESMAGSDPVSISQPDKTKPDKHQTDKEKKES